jgi:hypothetical protein
MSCIPCNKFGQNCMYKNKCGQNCMCKNKCGQNCMCKNKCGQNCMCKNKFGQNCMCKNKFGQNCMYKNKFGQNCMCKNKFGQNCMCKNKFGQNCMYKNKFGSMFPCGVNSVASFPSSRPAEFTYQGFGTNRFGVKSQSIKGYSSITKRMLTDFYILNGIDVDMSASKDKLFNSLKKIYSNITPNDIKLSVSTKDTIANIRSSKQRQKEAEERAKKEESERRTREKRDKIKKITYSPRESQPLYEFVSKRLPAGSKVKRLTRPAVRQVDIDDLSDMFSATRASPDAMSDLLSKLSVNFGKNKFGA